jgi:hypothetical protein
MIKMRIGINCGIAVSHNCVDKYSSLTGYHALPMDKQFPSFGGTFFFLRV